MRAAILAAGQGVRLRPLTDNLPKCMVPFAGRPLVARQLDALAEAGIGEVVFVVGYRAEQVSNHFGDKYRGMRLSYVIAKDYASTNNIVSFYVAERALLGDDLLLLEGDLLYDAPLLPSLLREPTPNVAVVDAWTPEMDGSVIVADRDRAKALVLKKDQGPDFDKPASLKTVNIYKFAKADLAKIFSETGAWVKAGRTDQYYEAVISDMLKTGKLELGVKRIAPLRWYETDTVEDLQRAAEIFSQG